MQEPCPDPLREVERLRGILRRWRLVALGSWFAFVLLGAVSVFQFLGTIETCRLLNEARKETVRAERAAEEARAAQQETEPTRRLFEAYLEDNRKRSADYQREESVRDQYDRDRLQEIDKELPRLRDQLLVLTKRPQKTDEDISKSIQLNWEAESLLHEQNRLKIRITMRRLNRACGQGLPEELKD